MAAARKKDLHMPTLTNLKWLISVTGELHLLCPQSKQLEDTIGNVFQPPLDLHSQIQPMLYPLAVPLHPNLLEFPKNIPRLDLFHWFTKRKNLSIFSSYLAS